MWRRRIAIPLALAAAGCGAASGALLPPGKRVAAPAHAVPRMAMVRLRSGITPLSDLILVTLGAKHDLVLSAGSHGGRLEPLTGSAAWSPDGRELAFARVTSGQLVGPHGVPYLRHDIFILNADGSGLHQLTYTSDAWEPVWSADGQQIIFARAGISPDGKSLTANMWSIRPDGMGAQELTPAVNGQADDPNSISPDGQSLAFTRVTTSPPGGGVYLLRLADGTVREIARGAADPSFSPDGKSLVISSGRNGTNSNGNGDNSPTPAAELYTIDTDGRHRRRLTHTRNIDETFPTFSPSGKLIAYERTGPGFHHAVFEMNADGSCPTPIRDDHKDVIWYFAPTWQPGQSRHGSDNLKCRP
jgi:Tol biopolymer transport system component